MIRVDLPLVDARSRTVARLTLLARLAAAVAALLVTWALTRPASVHPLNAGPRLADVTGLVRVAASLGHAVYWTGRGRTEVRVRTDGSVYVRYLPRGVQAGASGALPTVATYELAGAYAATAQLATRRGAVVQRRPDGGLVVGPSTGALDAYVAFPGVAQQVEVFAPRPGAALALAARVQPVGATSP